MSRDDLISAGLRPGMYAPKTPLPLSAKISQCVLDDLGSLATSTLNSALLDSFAQHSTVIGNPIYRRLGRRAADLFVRWRAPAQPPLFAGRSQGKVPQPWPTNTDGYLRK